jgi:chitinase
VLYGGGNGTFSTPVFAAAGSNPWALVTGDFNGDTSLDAATINSGDGNVSVLINDLSWPTPPPPPPPSVSINDATLTEGNTLSANMTFTLTLSFGYATPITVHYETVDGSAASPSDYTGTSGDVTFAPFQTSYPITIAVQGDRVWEPNESFSVNLTTTEAFSGDVHGVGTIVNDEPVLSIGDVTVTEGNTGSVNARFRLTLSAASDAPVTVHFATANGSATAGDFTATSGDATIPAGQTGIDVLIAVTGDRTFEPTESFVVNLSTPTNAGIADGQGAGTILDDEPRITINNVQQKEGNGLGNGNNKTLFVFTVSLSAAYDQAVTVLFATGGGTATAGSDYQSQTGTLTFAPGVRTMTITIVVVADKSQENDETFFVNLSGASNNALIEDAQGMATILDDDKRGKP